MIRFGLLGCGRIAKRHSDLLGGNHIKGASLVAVGDPMRARADAVASKFGVPACYDMDDFLARHPRRDALAAHLNAHGIQTAINYPTALPFLAARCCSRTRGTIRKG